MRTTLAVVVLAFIGPVQAADDPELMPLHPPKPVIVPAMPVESVSYLRTSMLARWQYYSVDQHGYFRPRVVLDFPEPYYLVNGRPYPLMPVLPRNYIPYILD